MKPKDVAIAVVSLLVAASTFVSIGIWIGVYNSIDRFKDLAVAKRHAEYYFDDHNVLQWRWKEIK